jgi:cold shock CspA family protein
MEFIKRMFNGDSKEESEETETEVESTKPERIKGKIIFINEDKGWGFINSHDLKFTRIFFHWQGLLPNTTNFNDLRKGMKVEFEPKFFEEFGWRAIKIKVLDE